MNRLLLLLTAGQATYASSTSDEEANLTMSEIMKIYTAEMGPTDWGYFIGGLSIGSIVEVGATMDHDSACLAQAAAVSQSGFLTYYYYELWKNPITEGAPEKMNFAYSSIYMGKLIKALN